MVQLKTSGHLTNLKLPKAIFYAKTPIISAVGHQIDYTISDYIADKRAATPSEAAEIAAFDINDVLMSLDTYRDTLLSGVRRVLNEQKNRLKSANDMLSALSPCKKLVQNKEKLSSYKITSIYYCLMFWKNEKRQQFIS